ncbi:hypothetical protein NQ315_002339 [Exocentrus adspersus]|uniref:DNA polymerase V n=1 Tax=Exocentrus adspersus TaxID=1586481 RepID=A0AAV8VST7_9CUCU|nr:hypothetical protein NQ315_002339 [Exocentrus adspersus]
MASDQHVEEVNSSENAEKSSRKLEKTILDSFTGLVNPNEKTRVKSGVSLLRHLAENGAEENKTELKYALGRIIRGLGSSTVCARTGFYTALVGLINVKDDVSVEDVLGHVEKELHKAGSNTKGENADVCVGQILTCGAVMRSKLWSRCTEEEQKKLVELLLKTCKERIYLSLVAYTFIADSFKAMEEKDFKRMFHLIKGEFSKPWAEQNIDSLYLLLCVKNKNPSYVKVKFLEKTVGTTDIICPASLEELCSILTTIPRVTYLKHPVYEMIGMELATSEHLLAFVQSLDSTLQRPNRNKQLIATKIYSVILRSVQDASLIPEVLTKNYIRQSLNYFKTSKGKDKDPEFEQSMSKLFETLLQALRREGVGSETKTTVLKKLLFYPGTKLVQQITASLDGEGVKMLARVYEGVVAGTERIDSQDNHWLNNDRLYAAHLLVKLLNHAAVKSENEWKTQRLVFLMNLSLFKAVNGGVNIGSELAGSLKAAFYAALDLKLSKLEDLQTILSSLVKELNSKLTPDNLELLLRSPIEKEHFTIWLEATEVVAKIEKKKKRSGLKSVFLTLFLHMALQLFNDAKLASDSLQELFLCYGRTRKNHEDDSNSDPAWIEVVTDLFLNLLSHNYHLLRSLIRNVFPHLCPYMTPSTIHQILSVIDPRNEVNPLSTREEDSASSEESGDDESDEESESEDEEMGDESVNDKLRMALHKALISNNGYQTDEESVDLDQLGEEEGEKLDQALAEAFKQYRPNHGKRKKQSKDQETLTHFRVRVLDLVEIYLDSTPSMLLTLEVMLPLLQAVEFSIRDEHQKPLLDRLRSCLKKLSSLKKFSDTNGVDEAVLGTLLKSLLEKGTKNSLIVQDMGVQISDCCVFVIRCSDILMSLETTSKKERKHLRNAIAGILSEELQNYFHKRDCLTPYVLFKNCIQLTWDGILDLVPLLLSYVFSEEVKPFKKNQALELLKLFYSNHRYLDIKPVKIAETLVEHHRSFFKNVNDFFKALCENPEKTTKEKFVSSLFALLSAMKTSRLSIENNWNDIASNVRDYRSFVTFSKDAKTAFNKLCNHLGVSHVVQVKPKVISSSSISENEGNTTKEKVNKKKKKTKNKERLKLKKEAKELRLNSLSEGFKSLDFTSATNVEIKKRRR